MKFISLSNISPEGVVLYTPTPLFTSKLQESCKTYIIQVDFREEN